MKIKSRYYLRKREGDTRDRRKFLWWPRCLDSGQWRWWEWALVREQVVKEQRGGMHGYARYFVWVWREVAFMEHFDSKHPDFKYLVHLKLDDGRSAVVTDWTLKEARLRACLHDPKSNWRNSSAYILARVPSIKTNRVIALEKSESPKTEIVFKQQTISTPEYCRHCGLSWDTIRPVDEEYTVPDCPRCHGNPTTPQSRSH